ncbi:type II toxin-antitoxin system HipA family toxin [Mycobacterium sp. SMC-19]|uniref:type II toxin-antitoxin system HipA family toxin n=1 Tax=Mycobacterium sp. SMC-19 TaxID=3381630 RepID=UPI003876027C
MTELVVALSGRIIGAITQVDGKPRFTYIDEYADDPDATPLSLSMPLAIGKNYDYRVTAPWLSNLLPDDDRVRENWAREMGVSASNATELLEQVGHDVAGAVQLAAPAEIENVLARQGSLEVVSEAIIGKRLRELVSHPSHWADADEGWSLAGAQSKFTVARTPDNEWAWAHGSAPSTHIIKPGIGRYPGQALNEHLCLRALEQVGIVTAKTDFTSFDGVEAIAVERYDRLRLPNGTIVRIHQEDMCQALSVWPQNKYTSNGGPSAVDISKLLSKVASQRDVDRFTDVVVAQYLLGAPDGHAKNYSAILDGEDVTLAPIYDVASILPYERREGSGLDRVAMSLGGHNKFGDVRMRHIERFATNTGTDPDRLVARTREMMTDLPAVISDVASKSSGEGLAELSEALVRETRALAATLDA